MRINNAGNGILVYSDSVSRIDWEGMQTFQAEKNSLNRQNSSFWDKYASYPTIGEIDQSYIDELMPRLKITPEMSVMDVGCGNGGISIALARKAREVVSLDISKAALDSLKDKIDESGLENIRIIHDDFSSIKIGLDVEACDVVLASRSLPMGNLTEFIEKIHSAARRLCYMVSGGSDNELTKWACSEIGIEYRPFPEYIITLNLLYTMGIHANVEIFDVRGTYLFGNPEEAFYFTMFGYDIDNIISQEDVTKLILSKMVPTDSGYQYNYRKEFVLMWWETNFEGN